MNCPRSDLRTGRGGLDEEGIEEVESITVEVGRSTSRFLDPRRESVKCRSVGKKNFSTDKVTSITKTRGTIRKRYRDSCRLYDVVSKQITNRGD